MDSLELTWEGGTNSFALPIQQMRALQQKCDAGPMHILNRLITSNWLVDDVVQTLRYGLEGGGLSSNDARELVVRYIETDHLAQFVPTCTIILQFALFGADQDDKVGKPQPGASET